MNDDYSEEDYLELRYITLELMKLAYLKNISFRRVAKEYIKNVLILQSMIEELQKDE
ncbi:MAG: hypothetical protein QXL02_02340 [Candidatus Anstonellales archaeon]